MTIFIERGIRHNDKSIYVEDIFVEQDSVWKNERRLAAFTITEDVSGPHVGDFNACRYRVNQRTQLDNGVYIYPKIYGAETVCECKEFIEGYINEDITQRILKTDQATS